MSWFGRSKPLSALEMLRAPCRCNQCGEIKIGQMDLACIAPDPWPHERDYEPNGALRIDGDFLSEDFCILDGKHFLIRAVLRIPVWGQKEEFGFGCWTTLSRTNFDKYVDGFDSGNYPDEDPWTGWLCNQLADYIGTEPEAVWVFPQPERQRPKLLIMHEDHPLAVDQEEGIPAERVLEIFRMYGHFPDETVQ